MLLLVVAGLHVFITAGVVFGWASLAEILAAEGALCAATSDGGCSGQAAAFAPLGDGADRLDELLERLL
eukprot:3296868-Prymnesium_polylepis.1